MWTTLGVEDQTKDGKDLTWVNDYALWDEAALGTMVIFQNFDGETPLDLEGLLAFRQKFRDVGVEGDIYVDCNCH